MMRKESLITYLVRLAQKIPFYISILLNAKSHYKNNLREAYLKAYKSFLGILQINELIIYDHWDAFKIKDLDPPFFLEFWVLAFPKTKLRYLFEEQNEKRLLNQLKIRKPRTYTEWAKMSKHNIWFDLTLKLFLILTEGALSKNSVKIVERCIEQESE